MGKTKQTEKINPKKCGGKKSAITIYWEKMGEKRGEIYDMKAVLK